jgi:hypothetical protein
VADDEQFQSLLEQIRELHRRTDEVTREYARLHEHVRARLNWDRHPPSVPPEQTRIADDAVEILTRRRLSAAQARALHRAFFRRQ